MLKTLIIIGVVAIMTSIGEAKTPEEEVLEVAREIIDASNRGDRAKCGPPPNSVHRDTRRVAVPPRCGSMPSS